MSIGLSWRSAAKLLSYVVIAYAVPGASTFQGGSVVYDVPHQRYKAALDAAFPVSLNIQEGVASVGVLRVVPSFGPEWQVSLTRRAQGGGTIEYLAVDRNLRKMLQNVPVRMREASPEFILRDMAVRRKAVDVSGANISRWQSAFVALLQKVLSLQQGREASTSASTFIVLDGNTYYFWFAQSTAVVSSVFSDSDLLGHTGDREIDPLLWANAVVSATGGSIPTNEQ